MGAPGMTSPIRTEAFQHLQLNAGIFLINFKYDDLNDAAAIKNKVADLLESNDDSILGITRGGGSFTVTREVRTPEVDGMRYPFKGSDFVDSSDAYLSGTLLEVRPSNIKRLIGTGEIGGSGEKHIITMHTAVKDEDYIEHLCWIGDLADGGYILIELDNAFNTADFSLTFTDKGEGTMTFEFHARQANVTDYDTAPFRVVFIDPKNED